LSAPREAKLRRKKAFTDAKAQDVAAAIRVEISGDEKRVRFNNSRALVVESFQMLERPSELCLGSE